MNEPVLAFLERRRSASLKSLGEPGPDAAQLDRLLRIASRVPDHGALAPWRFIVIQGTARATFADLVAEALRPSQPDEAIIAEARQRAAQAPLIIAAVASPKPHAKIPEFEQTLSLGAACMNLLSAATAMGFGAVWLTPRYTRDPGLLHALGIAPPEQIAGMLFIGSTLEQRADRERPDLARIVSHFGRETTG